MAPTAELVIDCPSVMFLEKRRQQPRKTDDHHVDGVNNCVHSFRGVSWS